MIDNFSKEDKEYMRKALRLAKKGEARVSPNPMVGAVVVKDGKVIGRGYHKFYGGPHAEVYALEEAGEDALGADIYINLEPCSHYGKTPPCANKIVSSGIKRAVVAVVDPNPDVAGKGLDIMREAGIEVELGLMSDQAIELNEIFIKYITGEYPFVYLKKAQTFDGYIASSTGDSKWITNKEARLEGHKLRHKVDAVMVGIGTVLADDPSLTTRLEGKEGIDSLRIILDPKLNTPPDAKIINQKSQAKTLIICGKEAAEKMSDKFKKLNSKELVEIISFSLEENGFLPLRSVLKELHKNKISSILVEGGAKISHSFINEGLIDKLYYFIAPKIYGGNDGIASFSGKGPELMSEAKKIEILESKKLGNNYLFIAKMGI